MKTAQEIKAIQNQMVDQSLMSVNQAVVNAAKEGRNSCEAWGLTPQQVSRLQHLGYTVSSHAYTVEFTIGW